MLKLIAILAVLSAPAQMIDGFNKYRSKTGNGRLVYSAELTTIANLGVNHPQDIGRWVGPMLRLRKIPDFGYFLLKSNVSDQTAINERVSEALGMKIVKQVLGLKAPCSYGVAEKNGLLITLVACADPREHREI